MDDTWAAKVLEGVPRHYDANCDRVIMEADALAAIARMGAGDGLVERLRAKKRPHGFVHTQEDGHNVLTQQYEPDPLTNEAAAHIAALTAERDGARGLAMRLQSECEELHAEAAALTATVAELEAEVEKVTSDRAYIIGANAGWEAAVEQGAATPAAAAVLARINEAENRIAAVANAAEAEAATLRDRLARMDEAQAEARGKMHDIMCLPDGADLAIARRWAADARAALTDGGKDG